jgi:hypothetical protein
MSSLDVRSDEGWPKDRPTDLNRTIPVGSKGLFLDGKYRSLVSQLIDAVTMVMLYLPGHFSRPHTPSLAHAKRPSRSFLTPRIQHNVLTTAFQPTMPP